MDFVDLNSDQRREFVNTRQRFEAHRLAVARRNSLRGSMVWSTSRGHDYLMRVGYDKAGHRKQKSLGPRSAQTELLKAEFDRRRSESQRAYEAIQQVMTRQAAVNRALGLGRVPLLSARILRALDSSGLLGSGIRVLGTHALYAYEAVAGVHVDAGLTATEDVDLLLDARKRLDFAATEDFEETSLIKLLQKIDKSFVRTKQRFRAVNDEGFMVDLVRPMRTPPWKEEPANVSSDPDDLFAVEITGLAWHENAPPFEAVAIDERGQPLRIVTSDPRVFAAHKCWLSTRADREPVKRRRDALQARCVAALTTIHLPHLPYEADDLRMLPNSVFEAARPLFAEGGPGDP
jgi:hypothetical protein